jgi:hypothetical protein
MGSLAYLGAADIVPLAAEEPPVYRAGSPKLLDRVRTAMRTRRMSGRTEEHAKRPAHVPMVLSHEEVAAVLSRLSGAGWLMVARSTGDHRTKETRSRRYPGL